MSDYNIQEEVQISSFEIPEYDVTSLEVFDFETAGRHQIVAKRNAMEAPKPGFDSLDGYISFVKGKTTVLGAETHVGKTTLTANIAANVASRQNKKVLMFVPESGVADTVTHIACYLSGKKEEDLTEAEIRRNIPDLKLIEKGITISEIEKYCKQETPDLVIIDHIHYLIKSADHVTASVSDAMRGLCEIAKRQNTHILIVSHLNKPARGQENEIPSIYRLKDSSGLYQDADIVILLHRKRKNPDLLQVNEDRFEMEGLIVIDKNRVNGKSGVVRFFFDKEKHTFLI